MLKQIAAFFVHAMGAVLAPAATSATNSSPKPRWNEEIN